MRFWGALLTGIFSFYAYLMVKQLVLALKGTYSHSTYDADAK